MFFQLLYIHLFRPFLKYSPQHSPLPSNVSPRKLCTTAAQMISKLLRLYKRSHGLRQICNIAVYITQNACTIHLLNLPDKNAKRDITHGVKHLEEIAESWLCARRTLSILSVLSKKWNVELPEEAEQVLKRCEEKFGPFTPDFHTSPRPGPTRLSQLHRQSLSPPEINPNQVMLQAPILQTSAPQPPNLFSTAAMPTTSVAAPGSLPPPNTAQDFHNYPISTLQAAQTPQTTTNTPGAMGSRHSIDSVTAEATPRSRASPSDMFGGVDQLLRTSNAADNGQDWWLRDQSQLALGFDNWADAAGWFATSAPGMMDRTSPTSMPMGMGSAMSPELKGVGVNGSAMGGGVTMGESMRSALSAMESANSASAAGGMGKANTGHLNGGSNGLGPGNFNGLGGSNTILGYDESNWYS